MSGECDKCGEHCLECTCKQKRPVSVTSAKYAIIGGDIHQRVSLYLYEKLRKNAPIPWFVEADKGYVWIPVPDERAKSAKGKWIWVDYESLDRCQVCKRKFFEKRLEG